MSPRALSLVVACTLCACGGRFGPQLVDDGGSESGSSSEGRDAAATDATSSSSSSSGGGDSATTVDDAQPESGTCDGCGPGCPATIPIRGTCDSNGLMCTYPGGPCTCTSGCTMGQCCPTSCAQLGFPCAPAGDGCGGVLHCRECPAGESCGKDGACLGPDAGCVPTPCPSTACGIIDDGCGGKIDCGSCYWDCILSGP